MDNKYQFKVVNKYPYTTYERSTKEDGTRTYSVKNKHVPSVTTILSATKDKTGLNEWRKRIGENPEDVAIWERISRKEADMQLRGELPENDFESAVCVLVSPSSAVIYCSSSAKRSFIA